MWIKIIIVILLLGVIASLTRGLFFLFKDLGQSKRTLYALGVRIVLACLLLIAIIYGFWSGELTMQAPWQGKY